MNTERGSVGIIVGIVIAVLVVGGLSFYIVKNKGNNLKPTNQLTSPPASAVRTPVTPPPASDVRIPADWKEYRDVETNISFMYPPYLTLKNEPAPFPTSLTRGTFRWGQLLSIAPTSVGISASVRVFDSKNLTLYAFTPDYIGVGWVFYDTNMWQKMGESSIGTRDLSYRRNGEYIPISTGETMQGDSILGNFGHGDVGESALQHAIISKNGSFAAVIEMRISSNTLPKQSQSIQDLAEQFQKDFPLISQSITFGN